MRYILMILFFLLTANFVVSAQHNTDTAFLKQNLAAVLVQVNTEHNRIEAMKKGGYIREMNEVEKDAAAVVQKMKLDFKDHFDFQPLYFYDDTNAERIKQKEFQGILHNADGSLATNLTINKSNTNYVIIYYGFPKEKSHIKNPVTAEDSAKYGDPYGKGLIILDDKYEQLDYVVKLGPTGIFLMPKKLKAYYYASKHFDIDYYPLATGLWYKLPKIVRKWSKK